MTITVVGLGPGSPGHLTAGALEALRSGRPVLLRTAIHPTVEALRAMGIAFDTCDDIYERAHSFEDVYQAVAERVLQYDDVVFAVPGHPLVGESSVKLIQARSPERVEFITGPSFLDTLLITLGLDPVDGMELLDALQLDRRLPSGDLPAVIMQMHSRAVASDAKLALMERYPDDHPATLVRAAGVPGEERLVQCMLHELDHYDWVDYLTTLYLPPVKQSRPIEANPRRWAPVRWPLDPLVEVMARLRAPEGGCPWDREQTHDSLRKYLLEESYEVVEAIGRGDSEHICEELGDVLLQVAFHAQIARESGTFDMHDVVQVITEKLVRRHPHVFGDVEARTADDVTRNWEAIKRQEKGDTAAPPESLMKGISGALPALSRAEAVQKKAAKVGFDWDDIAGPVAKVREELDEVLGAAPDKVEGEVGDLLFAVVNLARMLKVDPEVALTGATAKFIRRFQHIERRAAEQGRVLSEMTLAEMDELWDEAKREEITQKYGKK
ncbi:MAG TPA: nucleoside triphosphate pyrophosphohydrolase [Symbiobacteriaceae bacterium]|nr:nucleoside triphosphate pyrophosphohydrolase [Symbiobacteriaceae bacterium]